MQTTNLVAELMNVAGVYKGAVQAHEEIVESLCSAADPELSKKANELLSFLRGTQPFLVDRLLQHQEDIWGHPYELVAGSNKQRKDALGANTTIERLTYHADHLMEDESEDKEIHELYPEDFDGIENPQNLLEVALKEELLRNEKRREQPTAEEVKDKAKHYQQKSKEFIQDITDRFPLPVAIHAAGKICKRLLLVFRCAYGTKPDVIVKTVHWAKWLRTAAAALNQRKTMALDNSENPYEGLINLFETVSRRSIDPQLTLKTLCAQPYLSKGEVYELTDDLAQSGVFEDLQYDTTSWTWYRKQGASPTEAGSGQTSGESANANAATEAQGGAATSSSGPLKPKPPQGRKPSGLFKHRDSSSGRGEGGEESLPWQSSPLHWDKLDREDAKVPTVHGWMEKYSGGRKTLGVKKKSTRYFEIDANNITYYVDESKAERKGTISLHSVESIKVSDDNWVTLCTPNVHGEEYCIRPLNPRHITIIQERVKQGPVKRRRSQKLPDITQAAAKDTK
eukprot:gb/GECG01014778.1/.p1 GENE.gb/GECG01014778.1/~~gb/GECG01014778.1/.p1  ORF type:complete len:510 (+),score=75.02 gb/GECG01014778.1/:1-1530(+)